MITILVVLGLFNFNTDYSPVLINDNLGQWEYVVEAPDMTYKGIMELADSDGTVTGKIMSQGIEIPFTDVVLDGNELSFKMNVQGFPCVVKGTFEGDKFSGIVSVEGYELPLIASRK